MKRLVQRGWVGIMLVSMMMMVCIVAFAADHQKFDTVEVTDGSGIEALDGSKITSGDIPSDRMTANGVVVTDFTGDGDVLVGTGAGTFAAESEGTARTSLGVAIGSDVQAYSANLDELALNNAANLTNFSIFTGAKALVTWEAGTSTVYVISEDDVYTNKIGVYWND